MATGTSTHDDGMMSQLQAQLEGLAIGLEQRGEKSAAHICRMALAKLVDCKRPHEEMALQPNDIIEWSNGVDKHWWRVRGVHLGALGVESLVELECFLTHQPGWTGQWETHQMMFVPECLLRSCKVINTGVALS